AGPEPSAKKTNRSSPFQNLQSRRACSCCDCGVHETALLICYQRRVEVSVCVRNEICFSALFSPLGPVPCGVWCFFRPKSRETFRPFSFRLRAILPTGFWLRRCCCRAGA